MSWPTPQGLLKRLEVDRDAAEAALKTQGFEFGFQLRPYQRKAIEAVEQGLAEDRTSMLVGMATGTGKTKLAIAMLYRLIAAKRFRRVSYRNDALPKIAVTVDLLTTGVDVPKISNLVFLRRVNSRILYDQMLGRATRLCPEIGKETFCIFDAVDLYSQLQSMTDMRPVVTDPKISLTQLMEELAAQEDARIRADLRDQIIVKLSRRLARLSDEARAKVQIAAGETPEDVLARFRAGTADNLAAWIRERAALGPALDFKTQGGTPVMVPISQHGDEVVDVSHGYGSAERPEDYLGAFEAYVRENINKIAALATVVQRPRDLTRAALKELRLQLDAQGFTDLKIRRAWAEARNEDIAASIIGYVRQVALGDPLVPYADRVKRAVEAVIRNGDWNPVQVSWLRRIGQQLEKEVVVDRQSLDEEPFSADGGFRVIDKRLGGKLEQVLEDLNDAIWRTAYPWRIHGPNGEFLMDAPNETRAAPDFPPNNGIPRPLLHKVLTEAAIDQGVSVRLGVSVDAFEDLGDRVEVRFSDGDTRSYDLIVGCDGLYSRTRKQLFGGIVEPTFTGQAVWRYNLPRPPGLEWGEIHAGPHSKVGLVPMGPEQMYVFLVTAEPGNPWMDPDQLAALMRERMAGFTGRVAALREKIVDPAGVVYKPMEHLLLPAPWYRGRALIIGDAAHATTPHLAQGAAMAIEDAVLLGQMLGAEGDLADVLDAFMRRRFDRARFVIESSNQIAAWELEAWEGIQNPDARPGEVLHQATVALLEDF